MAKCLRCGATSEWIQGRVPDEPTDAEVLADLYSLVRKQGMDDDLRSRVEAAIRSQTDTEVDHG